MNKFELFCMIYYVLDAEWDESKNPQLGAFLSDANPFCFTDLNSANPLVYEHFCENIGDLITVENSYSLASEYIAGLGDKTLSAAFSTINEGEWLECVKDYLSQNHKGA